MSNFDTIMNIVRGGSAGSTPRKKKNSNFDNIMSIVRGESSYTQPAQTAYTPDAAARSIYENQMQTYFNQRTADVEARRKGEEYDTSGFAATEAAIRANPLFSDYEDQFDNLLGNISFNEDLNTYTARQQQNLASGREHINDPEAARLEKRLKEDPRWAEVSKEVDSFISGLKENRKARAAMAEALGVDFGEIKSALGLVTENGEYKSGEQLANDIIGLLGEREEAGKESYESSRNFFTDALLGLIPGAGLATMGGRIKDARNEEDFEKNKQERIDGINRNIDILTKFAHTFAGSEFEQALYRRQQEGQTRLAEFAGQAAAAQNEEDSRAAKSAAEAEAKSLKELQKLLSGYGTTQEQLLSLNAEEIQKKIDELENMKLQDPEGAYESEAARQRNIENTNAQMGIYSENAGWEALAANERDTALSLNSYIDSEISRLGQLKRLAENLKKTEEMQKSAEKLPAAELTEESLSLLGEEDRLMLSYMLGGRDAAEGVKMDTKSKALERVSEGMSDMQREEYLSGLEQEAENRRSSIIERIEAQASVRNTAEMTDAEKQTYAKLFLNKGAAAAGEYLDAMQDTLNARAGSKTAESVKGKWLAEGMAAFGGGVDQFFSGISQRLDTQLQPISKAQYASAEIRENLEKNEKSTALYDITSSVGNMAPAIAGSILLTSALGPAGLGLSATAASTIGSAASSVMMGASASGNAYAEALRQGYSEEQANSYSIMVGASEAALQYALGGISKLGGALSLGKIGTKIISRLGGTATRLAGNAFVQTAVKIAGNAVSEGIEEYLQTHLEKMFRNISFYEDNEIDPFDEEAIYSGVLGMITGGLLESLGTIRGTNKYKQLGTELTAKGLKAGIVDAAINSELETASLARLLKDGKIRGIGNESYALGKIAEEFMQADAEGWKRITGSEDNVKAAAQNISATQETADRAMSAKEKTEEIVSIARGESDKGAVIHADADGEIIIELSDEQTAKDSVFKAIAAESGINIVLTEDGRSNAEIDPIANTIYIPENAEDGHLSAAAYSMMQMIKRRSFELYSGLESLIIKGYDEQGEGTFNSRVKKMQNENPGMSARQAAQAVIAEECISFINGEQSGALAFAAQENPVLFETVGEYLYKLTAELKRQLAGAKPESPEAAALKSAIETYSKARKRGMEVYENNLGKIHKNTQINQNSNKFSLLGYSEHQINNWANNDNIIIYESETQLEQFINDAINHKNLHKKIYFGRISQTFAQKIESNTGINVDGYNCVLRASEVLKILKNHGNPVSEGKRGQRGITKYDLMNIPNVILQADSINLSDKEFEGKPVIEFERESNQWTSVAAYVSKKHLDLTVQTMYGGISKKSLTTATDEHASVNTSETLSGTALNNNIPQNTDNSQENVEKTEYKDKRAVLKYKSFDSYALNYKLNNNVELDETESVWSNELSSALSRIPDYKERTYRTLTFDMQGKDAYDNFIARHSVGEIVTYEGFTSSAKTKDGYPIEGERNVFLKIDGLHGKEINSLLYDNTDAEGEVLFDKKSQFIVQSVYEENGMLNIELKEIDYEIGREEQVDSSGRGKDSSVQQVRSQKNGTGRGQDSEVQGVSEGNPEGDNEGGLQSLREALPGGQRDIGREETGEEIGKDAYGRTYEEFDKKTDRKRKVISGDSIRESISQLSRDIQDTAAANGISSKELTKARLIADGTFSEEDISARDNKNVILDIAELYRKRAEAEASYTDIVAGQAKTEPGEITPDRLKKRMYDAEARANEVCLKYQLTKTEKIAAKKLAIDPDYTIPAGLSAENVKKGAAEWAMAYAAQREYMQSVDWVPLNRISRDSSKEDIYNAVIETENLSFRLKNEIAGFADKHSLTESQKEAANQIANGHYDIKSLKLENKKAVVEYAELLKRKRTVNESLRKRRRSINEGYYNIAEELTANSDSWKDFPAGVGNIRGMQRTFESAAKNDPNLSKITDIFKDVTVNEAERNRLGNAIKEPISKMKLTYMENVLVQMVGEELISADDAVKLAKEAGDKKATKERILKGAELLRKNYDTLFDMLNRKLVETGNKPIGHIDNYFAHFNTDNAEVSKAIKALGGEPGQSVAADNIAGIVKVLENSKKAHDSFVSNLKEALGEDIIKAEGLPAYLEGNTANRKPQKAFSKHLLKRMGDATELHASKGFDIYYDSVSKLIFHTDDIKTLRAMETVLREKNAPKDIQEQIKNLRYAEDEDGNPISYEERTNKINELMEKQGTGPSGIINALGEYTNLLAGKKSMYDRPLEADITRKGMLLLGKAYSNVGVNMILGNISSALTNFIPAGQLMGEVAPMSGLRGLYSTAADIFRRGKSGFTEQSDFLTNRKGTDSLYKSKLTKVQNIAMKPMEIVDRITSQWVTRSFYFDAVRQGMDSETAMEYADRRAARLIGDRSLGAQPAIYSSQSRKLFTQFQYEVFNFFDHYIHDMPMEVKSMAKAEGWDARQTAARLAASYAGSALGIYIVNEILRAVRGSGAGFDPIDETKEIIEGINEGKSAWDILKNVAIGIAEETPFIGTWLGGGRYPGMSPFSNFDSIGDFIEGFKDLGKRWPEYTSFLMYFNPFGGYNQVKKTIEGTASAINGGVYGKKKNSEGKYEDYLKYSTDGAWEIIQSVLFGKSSTQSAQEYYDDISMSLTPKETEYYKKLDSVGMDKHEFVLLAAEISGLDEYEKAQYISAEYAEHEDFLYEAFVFNDQMREQFDRTAGSLKAKEWYELHTAESMTDDQTDAEVKAQMADGYGLSDAETERIYYNEVLSESQRDTLDGLKQQGVEISAREFFKISSAKALKDEYGDNISGSKEAAKAEAINELGIGFADAGKVAEAVGLDENDLYSAYEQGETPETKKAVIEACTAAGMSEEAAKNFYKQIKSAAKPEKMRLITENKALNEQQKAKAAAAAFTSDKEKAVYELAVSTGAMGSKLMKVYAEFKMEETGKGENLSREEMKSFIAKKGLNVWQVNTVYLLEASDKKEYNRRLNVMLQKAQMSADKKMEIKGVLWRK